MVLVIGFALIGPLTGRLAAVADEPVDARANSRNDCVVCHRRSTMAAAEVACEDCHAVDAQCPGAVEYEGGHVLQEPTTAMCAAWAEDPPDSGSLVLLLDKRLHFPCSKSRAYMFIVSLGALATVIRSVLDHARAHFTNPWLWPPTVAGY